MKIGILGSRGIPNNHGGFEQFAESLSIFLAEKGHEVFVYNSSNHPFHKKEYNGVSIIHCYDPENKIGTFGQFIYDFNCILDSQKRDFDILLQLGYTSNSVWKFLLPKNTNIITNMDGLEWKRSKYNRITRRFLKRAEEFAVKSSHYLIADSREIMKYLTSKYDVNVRYIAYGSDLFHNPDESLLKSFGVKKYQYNLIIARLEPENNIEIILDGAAQSKLEFPLLIIGKNDENNYGLKLTSKYKNNDRIQFLGGIYDKNILNNLRYFSNLYFHGHSVGGTNPSLIEAMASDALVIAHKNKFNSDIIENDGFYFNDSSEVSHLIETLRKIDHLSKIEGNRKKIEKYFNSDYINNAYLNLFNECLKQN